MKLYENITIGNFLFALGYAIRDLQQGSKSAAVGSVNLLQQTPADRLLADVLLNFGGVARLLEFKAEGARLDKEIGKHEGLKQVIEDQGLSEISREVHWYVETKATEDSLGLLSVPYLDAFPRETARDGRLHELVQSTAKAIALQKSSFTPKEIHDYLLAVKTVNGTESSGSGGLLLWAEPGGVLKFTPLEDMLELNMTHREWVKEQFERAEENHQLALDKAKAKELAKHQSYGPSLG